MGGNKSKLYPKFKNESKVPIGGSTEVLEKIADKPCLPWNMRNCHVRIGRARKSFGVSQEVEPRSKISSGSISSHSSVRIHLGRLEKHIPDCNNYIKGRSYFMISKEEIIQIIQNRFGTGERINDYKERIDVGKVIGMCVDKNGVEKETTAIMIHRSKDGCHAVPAQPIEKNEDKH